MATKAIPWIPNVGSQVIFYSNNDIRCYQGICTDFHISADDAVITTPDYYGKKEIWYPIDIECTLKISEKSIELDPTTMKRIAKYNANKELSELSRKIELAKNKLSQLRDEIFMQQKKIAFIDKNTQKILECDDFYEDEWLPESVKDDFDED